MKYITRNVPNKKKNRINYIINVHTTHPAHFSSKNIKIRLIIKARKTELNIIHFAFSKSLIFYRAALKFKSEDKFFANNSESGTQTLFIATSLSYINTG